MITLVLGLVVVVGLGVGGYGAAKDGGRRPDFELIFGANLAAAAARYPDLREWSTVLLIAYVVEAFCARLGRAER